MKQFYRSWFIPTLIGVGLGLIIICLIIALIPIGFFIWLVYEGDVARANDIQNFQSHRAQYYAIVDFARSGQLRHNTRCVAYDAFAVPEQFKSLIQSECLFADWVPLTTTSPQFGPSSLEFTPSHSSRLFVYVDSPSTLNSISACTGDGFLLGRLDEHWY